MDPSQPFSELMSSIAIVGHQDREADRRLRGRDREDEERKSLAGQIARIGRKGDEVDVDRQ
jgi:hypothetical protein